MKRKGIAVTAGNIGTIAGHIRNALRSAKAVTWRVAYVPTRRRALALFASNPPQFGWKLDPVTRQPLISNTSIHGTPVSLERSVMSEEPFIAIGGRSNRVIVHVGDRVDVTAQGILLRSQSPIHLSSKPQPKCFELIRPVR